jgi:capsular exopolysaccharide synthesis family protein
LAATASPPAVWPADEEAGPAGVGVAAFLRGLRRRWALAVLLGLSMLALAGGAAWVTVPEQHTAETLLRVEATQPKLLFGSSEGVNNFLNYQKAQAALVKSRLVLNAALRQPQVAELALVRAQDNPVEWLEKHLQADYKLAPEILRISLSGQRPQELKALVDAIRSAYLQEIVDKERNENQARLERLKKLQAEYDQGLRDKRRSFRELAQTVGAQHSQTLAHQHQLAVERLAAAQKDLTQVQSDLRKALLDLADQEAREKASEGTVVVGSAVDELLRKDPLVERQMKELAEQEMRLAASVLAATRGEDDPAVRALRAKVEGGRRLLETRKKELRPQFVKEFRERARGEVRLQAAALRGRVSLLQQMQKELLADVGRREQESRTINKGSIDLESVREDLSQLEDMAKKVTAQVETLKVESQAPSRISLLEEAVVSNAEGRKRRLAATAGAALGGALVALAGLGWWEMRSRRIGTVEEVTRGLRMRLVGTLPQLPERENHLGGGGASLRRHLWVESVDAMRTLLLKMAGANALRSLMITSAASGEGKTSLSAHLAASLARVGFRTLLIDADLRNPSLHRPLGLPLTAGLSELLREEARAEEAVRQTELPGLSFLPAGLWDTAALQSLARERGPALLQALEEQFDFVIIDSAPVLPVADSLLIAQHVDGVLLSLLRDVSRGDAVLAAQERLEMLGVRLVGAVVNGALGAGPRLVDQPLGKVAGAGGGRGQPAARAAPTRRLARPGAGDGRPAVPARRRRRLQGGGLRRPVRRQHDHHLAPGRPAGARLGAHARRVLRRGGVRNARCPGPLRGGAGGRRTAGRNLGGPLPQGRPGRAAPAAHLLGVAALGRGLASGGQPPPRFRARAGFVQALRGA